mgnify:CR=1 FL=1
MVLHLRDKAEYRKLQLFLDVLAIDDVVMEQVVEDQNAAGRHNAAESSDQDVLLRLREDGVARDLHVAHDLAGAGLHLVHDDIGGSLGDGLHDLSGQGGVLVGDRDGHDLGRAHAVHRDAGQQLTVGHIQTQLLDDVVQDDVALDDDCISVDEIPGRVDVVTGNGSIAVLPGIDDQIDGGLIAGRQYEGTDQQADDRCRNAGRSDLQCVAPEKPRQLEEVDLIHVMVLFHNVFSFLTK